MHGKANLYFALGELCYAIAKADGTVQREERDRLFELVTQAQQANHWEYDVAHIIFHLLEKEHMPWRTVYDWAIEQLRLYNHYLTPAMKTEFLNVAETIAHAFDSVTIDEQNVLGMLRKDLAGIEAQARPTAPKSPAS